MWDITGGITVSPDGEGFAQQETEIDRQKRQEREIRDRIAVFSASDRLSREEVHSRLQAQL